MNKSIPTLDKSLELLKKIINKPDDEATKLAKELQEKERLRKEKLAQEQG